MPSNVRGTLDELDWFWDERFQKVGQLRLELLIGHGLRGDWPLRLLQGRYVTSTPAFLRILEPTGHDAAVWKAISDSRRDTSGSPEERWAREAALWLD